MVGAALPVIFSASGSAASLAAKRAPVAACSPPGIATPPEPVADASPPCNPTLKVRPGKGLRDLQTVTVSGSGFPSDTAVFVLECQSGATSDGPCESDGGSLAPTSDTGTFSVTVSVERLLDTGSTEIDCAQKAACEFAASPLEGNTLEASTPIAFKNVPLPMISATPDTGLADGQVVTLNGSNFTPGEVVQFAECVSGSEFGSLECDNNLFGEATAGADGTFSIPYNVARLVFIDDGGFFGSTVDCAVAPGCELDTFGTFNQAVTIPTPLAFDPSIPPLSPLGVTLTLASTGHIGVAGAVVLSGTLSCTTSGTVDVTTALDLTQTADALSAGTSLTSQQTCSSTPAPVSFTLPNQGLPFVAGVAHVGLDISARDGSAMTQQTLSGAVTLSVAAGTPPPVYYVALGDSLAIGPIPGDLFPMDPSYVNDLFSNLQAANPNMELVDLACGNETTSSMLVGGFDCPFETDGTESQLSAAITFLAANRASVALVTLDIGGFDDINCIVGAPPYYDPHCISLTNAAISTNLATILTHLKTAAGPAVPIAGMNYFDPFLPEWGFDGVGHLIVKDSLPIVETVNSEIDADYAAAGVPVADVQGAFQITDFSHKVKTPEGRVPVAVANACNWLNLTCSQRTGNIGTGTDAAGAAVIAAAFEKVLPPGLSAGKKKRR
jgi:hypothetical protein